MLFIYFSIKAFKDQPLGTFATKMLLNVNKILQVNKIIINK